MTENVQTLPEFTPGAMGIIKTRLLPGGYQVDFEFAPAGFLKKDGEPRRADWRAYYLSVPATPTEKRARVESVTTICDRILPKDGLPPWSERMGITGTLEAFRRGLLTAHSTPEEAVQVVRSNKLGADRARDEAADRGLNVHAILEDYMAHGRAPNPADHPEPHRPFIRGLVKWLLWADPEPVAVEMLVADPERGYAGRLDLLANTRAGLTLVDLKTQENGAIYEAAHVQARLYRDAEERFGEHRIQHGLVVVVDGYGGFREMDLAADAELSTHALDFYRRVKPLSAGCDSQNRAIRQALKAAA
jgi:hypothetical protein